MSKKIWRVGMVGAGGISSMHLEGIARHPDQLQAVAATDPDPQALAETADKYDIPRRQERLDQMLAAALDVAAIFGHVAIIGECETATIEPSGQFNRKELTLSGSTVFPATEYDELCQLFADGLAAERFITHRYSVEQAAKAYQTFTAGDTGKVVFVPSM